MDRATRCEQAAEHERSVPFVAYSSRLDTVSGVVKKFNEHVQNCNFQAGVRSDHDWKVFKEYLLSRLEIKSESPNKKIVKLKTES